ncbi:response regulator transcription factor [Pontixanthobacter gangjinensis]|uniref:Response regulator n=1 Tax=Pontixanthobacter gangjinensis TaxID=1028742 RepID=A0A6I4SM03_9SPHN|nr:response regulator transcription factor [Pontixanthobacter gangjinensis]MXO56150.1 response regulator [Pontixanthobacter gangjinensis]
MRIAIADDDLEILEQLASVLEGTGHQFDKYRNGNDLIVALKRETFDVVVADWNMPGSTGVDVLKWAKDAIEHPPAFILITSRAGKSDVVKGLELGATDYIIKPESSEVILARIEAAGRKIVREKPDRFAEFADFKIDRLKQIIEHDGEPVKLTSKEFSLALLFFENLNRPLSRSYIFSQIWGGSIDVETRTLDMHVSRVRSKLGLRPQNGYAIQTVFGFGYRMDKYSEFDED